MSATLTSPTTTKVRSRKGTKNGRVASRPIANEASVPEAEVIDTRYIIDIDGPGFESDDPALYEKGDFPPVPLARQRLRPMHPGEILHELYLPPTGLTQSEFAARLGVSRHALTQLLHGRRPLTVDMAHRLARVLGTSPELWLGLQRDCDDWDALHVDRSLYDAIEPLPRK